MHFPPKFLQKPSPYFLHGAFAPLFIWCRRPWRSVLWHYWLGVRKSIRPQVMRCWRDYPSGARSKWFAYCKYSVKYIEIVILIFTVIFMPLPPHHLLFHENPDWFNFSGAGLLRLTWKKRPLKEFPSVCFGAN